MDKKITAKQIKKVNQLIEFLGRNKVVDYITSIRGFKNTDVDNLTRKQAQKIITGLGLKLPSKVIYGVYGRDIF